MHVRPRLRYLAVLGLAGLALAAVGVTAAQSKPLHSTASTIIDGTTDTVTNVDPAGNYDYGSATVDLLVYQHLLDYPEGHRSPTPSLATGCTANSAQTAWTCTLKKGVKLSNGGVIINYYSKSSTMKLALQQGTIDMAFRDFTPTEYAALGTTSGITVFKGSGVVIRYLVLNVKRAPTNNVGVRKAIAYLFPRQDIATRIYHGNVQPLYSMVPAGLPGHVNAFGELYGMAPSTAKAKAVLKAAHVKTPIKLTVWWTPSHYGDASADEYTEIQRALNASKLFKVTLKSAEWATYSKTLGTQYGAFQLGWFPDYVDAEDYLVPFYASGSNFTSNGYKSAKMDAILKNEQGAKTDAQRLGFVKQAQALAAKDAPIIPYWQGAMLAVGRSDIHGIQGTLDPTYLMRFWEITKS